MSTPHEPGPGESPKPPEDGPDTPDLTKRFDGGGARPPEPTRFDSPPPPHPTGGDYGYQQSPVDPGYPAQSGYPTYPQGGGQPYEQQPYEQQPYGQQPYGQQPYGQPYPGGPYGAPQQSGTQTYSIIGFVCAGIALLLCPLLGIVGIVLGIIGNNKGEPLGKWAAIAAGVCMVIGFGIGLAVYGSNMMNNS
ncbi:hypothetical protein GPX89_30895 [Nocardia sp. ET3-3]|uniref:DUF4190 domain-containing protein n=1 Tax=Nocardia terrae TaxID=2675851 RepID=A0A7K1V4T8_9NOCA|nr:DUF4190 domain-containing protein [Nocardia terrae]MVU81634.1 hypothetical protein [Nocardia terrae]